MATTFSTFDLVDAVPASAVAQNGTITFAYPTGKTAANYNQASGGVLLLQQSGPLQQGAGFTVAYGGSIVVTYTAATPIPAGTRVRLQAPLNTFADGSTTLDMGASYSQATANAIVNSLATQINQLKALLRASSIQPR